MRNEIPVYNSHALALGKKHQTAPASWSWSSVYFAVCCVCVAAVSVHDSILIILNDDVIFQVEQNPIGRWLIALQGGSVQFFVAAKLLGTSVVCALLITLNHYMKTRARAVATGVACFQICLLVYLQTH